MKKGKTIKRMFGTDEYGFEMIPAKISNIRVARIQFGDERGCSYCFPHGWETSNSTRFTNAQRSWKKYRKAQFLD